MSALAVIVTIVAAVMVGFSAVSVLAGARWVVEPLADYGVPRRWWPWLGVAKAAGALGLLVGLLVPPIGVVAAVALVVYFLGAVVTVLRAHAVAHVLFPPMYAAPVVGALVLGG